MVTLSPQSNPTPSLQEKLSSYSYTSTTEGGYQWLRKALHPAEPSVKAPRIPGHGVRPTATQECTVTFTLDAPGDAIDDTWSFRLCLKNDPLCPVHILSRYDTSSAPAHYLEILNQCFLADATPVADHGVEDYTTVLRAFRRSCEQYRVTALSVTGYFIGASLSDQGSVIASQMSDPHQWVSVFRPNENATAEMCPRGYLITQQPATVDAMVMGTTSYVAPAKEGFYMPYKMTDPETWHPADNVCYCFRTNTACEESTIIEPLYQEEGFREYPRGNVRNPDADDKLCCWLPPVDDGIGVIHLRSIAKTSSIRITVRICVEMMTRPDSSLAAFAEPPALPDEHAMRMYYEIASRLNDAYPGKDNANGTLWQKIKNVAGSIWDVVSPAMAASGVLAPVATAGNAIRALMPSVEKVVTSLADGKKASQKQLKSAARSASERATMNPILAGDPDYLANVTSKNEIMARAGRKGRSASAPARGRSRTRKPIGLRIRGKK